MVIYSPKCKEEYLSAMKEQRGSWSSFGSERFTGLVLGNVFCMSYHMDLEWDRRTNPKTTAIGYVTQAQEGCSVRCLLLRGAFRPQVMLPLLLLTQMMALIEGFGDEAFWILPVAMLLAAAIPTLMEWLSARGQESGRVMTSFLLNPADPYANLNRI